MVVRPYLKVGVAFAAAGMIAVTPAIAPPLAPRDVQVVKATEAQMKLTATVTDLINTFFGVDPQNGVPVDPDNPGTFGASGVLFQILMAQTGNNELVNGFFTGGVTGLTQQAALALLPGAEELINTYFEDGITGVTQLLLDSVTTGDAKAAIDAFFANGTSGLAHLFLNTVGPAATDNLVNIFFNIDNPYGDVDDAGSNTGVSSNPALFGASGLTYQLLSDLGVAQPGNPVDDFFQGGITKVAQTQINNALPGLSPLTDAFFEGGTAGLSQLVLLSLLPAGTPPADLVNEFYTNGVSGVVRYLLAGPAPEAPAPAPVTMLARSFSATEAPEESTPELPKVEALKVETPKVEALTSELPKVEALKVETPKVETPKVETLSATVPDTKAADTTPATPLAVVASAPAALPAPAAETPAAPAPDPKPKFTAKIHEKPKAEETEVADDGGANKVEPIIIEEGGKPKDGEGSWGIFGQIAGAVHDAIAAAGAPAASTGATGGTEGGS